MTEKLLIEHIRKSGNKRYRVTSTGKRYKGTGGGNPIGSVVAIFDTEKNSARVGWSLCHDLDMCKEGFNPRRAVEIALGRAKIGSSTEVPKSIKKKVMSFVNRVKKYYKTETVIVAGAVIETKSDSAANSSGG